MIVAVEVDVALSRPPRADATVYCQVEARSTIEAREIACQMSFARANVVMPVAARAVGVRA